MYLIDRDQLLQALKDHIDRHGVYRHSYERMGIEQLILSITPSDNEENERLKQQICQYEDIIDDLKSRVKSLCEVKKDLLTQTQRSDFLKNTEGTRCGVWKKQERFKLYETPLGKLAHNVINVYICDRCGYTTDSLASDCYHCPKCGSLNTYQSE